MAAKHIGCQGQGNWREMASRSCFPFTTAPPHLYVSPPCEGAAGDKWWEGSFTLSQVMYRNCWDALPRCLSKTQTLSSELEPSCSGCGLEARKAEQGWEGPLGLMLGGPYHSLGHSSASKVCPDTRAAQVPSLGREAWNQHRCTATLAAPDSVAHDFPSLESGEVGLGSVL
jgi:hypothetical protein